MAVSTTSGLCSVTCASSAVWPGRTDAEIWLSTDSVSSASSRSTSEPTISP